MSGVAEAARKRRGLGMGLSALLGGDEAALAAQPLDGVASLPIEHLQPSRLQPRTRFDEDELEALAESIRAQGVIQPLVVRPAATGEGYEIVAGERRWRAAQLAGLHELPVVVRELSDRAALELALIENVQRQDLNPLEEAAGYQRLIAQFGHTQEALASTVGKSRSHVANTLRLLQAPPLVRRLLVEGRLSAGHARALLGSDMSEVLAEVVVRQGLSVRQTEELVRAQEGGAPATANAVPRDPNVTALEGELALRLGLKVAITPKGKEGGVISFRYATLDQLDGLLRRLQDD